MTYITTQDGTRIFYKDWGPRDAHPIVFHHGWPLSSDDWDNQMMFFLTEGYRVIAHDRRGHGRSDQTDGGNDMDTYAADVAALVMALDLKNVRPLKTSGRPVPVVSLGYLSVECPLNKIYGINCRPELGAKLLDRFFHRRRQVSPPVDHAAHRIFHGSHHVRYCNGTVGSRHSGCDLTSGMALSVPSRSCPSRTPRAAWPAASRWYWRKRGGIGTWQRVLTPSGSHSTGTSAGAPLSLIRNTRNFAGLVALAFRSTT
jgi:hypothetical protein